MGPTYIKFGPIASTRPDILPPEFIDKLGQPAGQSPAGALVEIQAVIEAELGRPLAQLFLVVESHADRLSFSGPGIRSHLPDRTEVIVKVQRPNIEQTIETDLAILTDLAQMAQERLPGGGHGSCGDRPGVRRIAAQRARLPEQGARRGPPPGQFTKENYLRVPKVYWEYTTRHIEVQGRMPGIKINDYPTLTAAGYDRDRLAMNAAKALIKQVMVDGFFHADPHPGNLLILPGEVICLIDSVASVAGSDQPRVPGAALDRGHQARRRGDRRPAPADGHRRPADGSGRADGELRRAPQVRRTAAEGDRGERDTQGCPLIYEYKLNVPTDYWLLIKTLVTMEGVGKALAPGFDVFAASGPYVQRFVLQMALPQS